MIHELLKLSSSGTSCHLLRREKARAARCARMFRLRFVSLNMTVLKCLYRDKVSIRHPETDLYTRLTKDLSVRRIFAAYSRAHCCVTACIYTAKKYCSFAQSNIKNGGISTKMPPPLNFILQPHKGMN